MGLSFKGWSNCMRKCNVFAEQRNRKLNPPQVSTEQRLANIAVTHRKHARAVPDLEKIFMAYKRHFSLADKSQIIESSKHPMQIFIALWVY